MVTQYFRMNNSLACDYSVHEVDLTPVVVYAGVQPLSIDDIRKEGKVSGEGIITTTD